MTQRSAFRLPEGVRLDITSGRLDIAYEGDVEIEEDFGRSLGTVRAGGDLSITLAKVTGDLWSGGTLRVRGPIDGGSLHAREIVLGRQPVRCRAISAEVSITIGAADLTVDVIIAPEIVLDPKASGRVTVIESANERGPTKIKGGFSLADFEDTFGGAAAFLAERGVTPLAGREPELAVPEAEADSEEHTTEAEGPAPAPIDAELDRQLRDALGRIAACYDAADTPPDLARLGDLVARGDTDGLRATIADVWNGIVGFHRERGLRPHHQVTYAFNVIHGLVHG